MLFDCCNSVAIIDAFIVIIILVVGFDVMLLYLVLFWCLASVEFVCVCVCSLAELRLVLRWCCVCFACCLVLMLFCCI